MPMRFSAPVESRMTRESMPEATVSPMRQVMFALMRPVTTLVEGRWVAMMRWMPAARGRLGDAADGELDLLAPRSS